jgi:hypothetical protein
MPDGRDPWPEIDKLVAAGRMEEAGEVFIKDWEAFNANTVREAGDYDSDRDTDELFEALSGYVARCIAPLMIWLRQNTQRLNALDENGGLLAEQVKALEARLGAVEKQASALRNKGIEYRGVWTDHDNYDVGHCATWGGSLWICTREAPDKPGEPDSGWKLCVKAGARGRDAPDNLTHALDALERRVEALEGTRKPRQLKPVSDGKGELP